MWILCGVVSLFEFGIILGFIGCGTKDSDGILSPSNPSARFIGCGTKDSDGILAQSNPSARTTEKE